MIHQIYEDNWRGLTNSSPKVLHIQNIFCPGRESIPGHSSMAKIGPGMSLRATWRKNKGVRLRFIQVWPGGARSIERNYLFSFWTVQRRKINDQY